MEISRDKITRELLIILLVVGIEEKLVSKSNEIASQAFAAVE